MPLRFKHDFQFQLYGCGVPLKMAWNLLRIFNAFPSKSFVFQTWKENEPAIDVCECTHSHTLCIVGENEAQLSFRLIINDA